jgi:hypothetical protein
VQIAGQPIQFAINPQDNLTDKDGLNQFSLLFTATLLVPSSWRRRLPGAGPANAGQRPIS